MAETKFEKNVMHEINDLKKVMVTIKREFDSIKDKFADRLLSEDDKKAIDETLKAEKEGRLKSMDEVFD